MDQAPAALSNILGSALDEIREEFNELKQSNTSLVKKHEELDAALVQSQTNTAALESQQTESMERIAELHEALEAQAATSTGMRVSLTEVQNENSALRELLMALSDGQGIAKSLSQEEKLPEDNDAITIPDEEEERNDVTKHTERAAASPIRPSFRREASVESSMTFFTAEQSMQRRKRQHPVLLDKPIALPQMIRTTIAETIETDPRDGAVNKRRKTVRLAPQNSLIGDPAVGMFPVPALPHRPATADASFPHLPGNASQPHASQIPRQKDVEMEDNIDVLPKFARSTFRAINAPAAVQTSTTPRASQTGRVADDVIQIADVSTGVEPSAYPQKSKPSTGPAPQSTIQDWRGLTQQPQSYPAISDPNIIDQDTGLAHQPRNRGENDQTGVADEFIYSTASINGQSYTIDRSRAHADSVQEWKSWVVSAKGKWYQWKHYSSLDWTNSEEVEKMSKWREQALKRVGFPSRRTHPFGVCSAEERDWLFQYVKAANGNVPSSSIPEIARQCTLRFGRHCHEETIQDLVNRLTNEYKKYDGGQRPSRRTKTRVQVAAEPESEEDVDELAGDGEVSNATANQTQASKSITRSALLSQFKARTGEMQKVEGSQSLERKG